MIRACLAAIATLTLIALASSAADLPTWQTIKPADGSFSAEMPAEPKVIDRDIDAPPDTLRQSVHYCKVNGSLYTVQAITRPALIADGARKEALDNDHKAFIGTEGTMVVRDEGTTIDGLPGWDVTVKNPGPAGAEGVVTARIRLVLADRTSFFVSVIGPPNGPLPDDSGRFLDSFHLTPKALNPPRPASPVADSTPEQALRSFLIALMAHDEPTLRVVALPTADFEKILGGQDLAPAQLIAARVALAAAPIRALKAGEEIDLPGGHKFVVAAEEVAEDRAFLLPEGQPVPTRLRRIDGRWRVDARPVIAARKAAEAAAARLKATPEGR